jgi:hypothetical protein
MKSIIFLFFSISLLAIGGCNKQLNQYPPDKISTPTFWKTASDAQQGLTTCYNYIYMVAYDYLYFDGATDNIYSPNPWESSATNISAGNISAATVNGLNGMDGYSYANILYCNTFLDNIGNVQMDETTKDEEIGEVRFLRAFYYFLLAYQFGDVPLVTTSNVSDILSEQLTPTKESDVISFVLKELDTAAQYLPVTPADVSRASKGAALALKARVELVYGNYADAANDAQAVMNLGKYSLFRLTSLGVADALDRLSQFVTFSNAQDSVNFYLGVRSYQNQYYKSNEASNPELIFVSMTNTNPKYAGVFGAGINAANLPSNLNGWGSLVPTQSMVDAYWNRDGSVHTSLDAATRATLFNYPNTTNPAYFDDFKNRDPRFYASIIFPSVPVDDLLWAYCQCSYTYTWAVATGSKTSYNFRKMVDPAYLLNPAWSGGQSFPLLRYAEVLLTYAEAKNEVSGPDQTIYNALNQIRDRVSMPHIDQTVYNSQATLRQLIWNERRIELAEEGERYFDIRRWNIAAQVMTSIYDPTNSQVQARTWQPNFVKLPYPQAAVDQNADLKAAQTAKGY